MQACKIQGPHVCLDELRACMGDLRSPQLSDWNACTCVSFDAHLPRHSLGMLRRSAMGPTTHMTRCLFARAPRPEIRSDALRRLGGWLGHTCIGSAP